MPFRQARGRAQAKNAALTSDWVRDPDYRPAPITERERELAEVARALMATGKYATYLECVKVSEMEMEPEVDVNDRDSLLKWHLWNDPNGCYTDEDCEIEGSTPCTLEELRDIYRFATTDDTAPLIAELESGRHLP